MMFVTATAWDSAVDQALMNAGSSPTMTDVTARASTSSSGGQHLGVYSTQSSSPTMNHMIATATGSSGGTAAGILTENSSVTMNAVTAKGSGAATNYGVWNAAASGAYTVRIINSQISGGTNTIFNNQYFTTLVGG